MAVRFGDRLDPADLVGQYFLQVWLDGVWRQGQILAVHDDDDTMEAKLVWPEPDRPPERVTFTIDGPLDQFALFDTVEETWAAYERYHPGEIAELAEIAARGAVH
jgi:hypothetical protein